mgnify:CR=1 FL=1
MPKKDDYLDKRHERREAARKKREAESRRIRVRRMMHLYVPCMRPLEYWMNPQKEKTS